jgi:ornithine--oxo-acid transaminase
MLAIEFGPPKSMALKTAWAMTHRMDENLFPQAVTIPLMDDHGILTQVAGHNLDVIKLLPPLVMTQEDVAFFLDAFEQVMKKLHRFPGPVWEVLAKLGKLALSKRAS